MRKDGETFQRGPLDEFRHRVLLPGRAVGSKRIRKPATDRAVRIMVRMCQYGLLRVKLQLVNVRPR